LPYANNTSNAIGTAPDRHADLNKMSLEARAPFRLHSEAAITPVCGAIA
jgi:hypothetical protein